MTYATEYYSEGVLTEGSVTRSELYRLFGEVNVRRWADMDAAGENAETINTRIDHAIAVATEYVLGSLSRKVNTESALLSLVVRDVIARFAGLSVHDARGFDDTDDGKVDPMQKHRKLAAERLKSIQCRNFESSLMPRIGGNVPGVFREDEDDWRVIR